LDGEVWPKLTQINSLIAMIHASDTPQGAIAVSAPRTCRAVVA